MTLEEQLITCANNQLFEMAFSRKDFISAINNNLTKQLVQNWVLVHYGKRTNNILTNHWVTELTTVIYTFVKMKLKAKNQNVVKRECFQEVWYGKFELNDVNSVMKIMSPKIIKEHINENDIYEDCLVFSKSILPLIVLCCTTSNRIEILNYINQNFK